MLSAWEAKIRTTVSSKVPIDQKQGSATNHIREIGVSAYRCLTRFSVPLIPKPRYQNVLLPGQHHARSPKRGPTNHMERFNNTFCQRLERPVRQTFRFPNASKCTYLSSNSSYISTTWTIKTF